MTVDGYKGSISVHRVSKIVLQQSVRLDGILRIRIDPDSQNGRHLNHIQRSYSNRLHNIQQNLVSIFEEISKTAPHVTMLRCPRASYSSKVDIRQFKNNNVLDRIYQWWKAEEQYYCYNCETVFNFKA